MKRGKLEQEINSLTAKIYKEMLGKGPKKVKSKICEDLVIVRIERCNTIIFDHLSSSVKGREVLKSMREKLCENFEEDAEKRYGNVLKKVLRGYIMELKNWKKK